MNNIYDAKKIGNRIKAERQKLNIFGRPATLESLGEKIGVARQTLSKWERGDEHATPSLWNFLDMCNLFGCELGYLLCEYDCKTRAATDIQKETGLSEAAIHSIQNEGRHNPAALAMLDQLLQSGQFWVALEDMACAAVSRSAVADILDDPRMICAGFSIDELVTLTREISISHDEKRKLHLFHASSNFTEVARNIVKSTLQKEAATNVND